MIDDQTKPLLTRLQSFWRSAYAEAPALLVGIGSGRNLPPFLESDRLIFAVDESETRVAFLTARRNPRIHALPIRNSRFPLGDKSVGLLLSTHVFQHGTWAQLRNSLRECARVSRVDATAAFVFASIEDERYGLGRMIEKQCYVQDTG